MRKILILLLITSITFGQNINPNFLDGTIMFKFENFVEAKDTSNEQLWTILHLATVLVTLVVLVLNMLIVFCWKFSQ